MSLKKILLRLNPQNKKYNQLKSTTSTKLIQPDTALTAKDYLILKIKEFDTRPLLEIKHSLNYIRDSLAINSDEKIAGASKEKEISQEPFPAAKFFEVELYEKYEFRIINLIKLGKIKNIYNRLKYIIKKSAMFKDQADEDRLQYLDSLIVVFIE